jgi:hypothetical protein
MLTISVKTVERHRANILEKLGMRDRVELTRYAIRRGDSDDTAATAKQHGRYPPFLNPGIVAASVGDRALGARGRGGLSPGGSGSSTLHHGVDRPISAELRTGIAA